MKGNLKQRGLYYDFRDKRQQRTTTGLRREDKIKCSLEGVGFILLFAWFFLPLCFSFTISSASVFSLPKGEAGITAKDAEKGNGSSI